MVLLYWDAQIVARLDRKIYHTENYSTLFGFFNFYCLATQKPSQSLGYSEVENGAYKDDGSSEVEQQRSKGYGFSSMTVTEWVSEWREEEWVKFCLIEKVPQNENLFYPKSLFSCPARWDLTATYALNHFLEACNLYHQHNTSMPCFSMP